MLLIILILILDESGDISDILDLSYIKANLFTSDGKVYEGYNKGTGGLIAIKIVRTKLK